jgi:beta-mannosidase
VRLFDGFVDLSYNYRFGPPAYDVMRAAFVRDDGVCVDAFHFPLGLPNTQLDVGLQATVKAVDAGIEVGIQAAAFAQSVHIEAQGYVADDQYFHLAPRCHRTITLRPRTPLAAEPFEGTVYALNSLAARRVGVTS